MHGQNLTDQNKELMYCNRILFNDILSGFKKKPKHF